MPRPKFIPPLSAKNKIAALPVTPMTAGDPFALEIVDALGGYYSPESAAALLGCSTRTLQKLSRKIGFVQLGQQKRYAAKALHDFIVNENRRAS